MENDTKLLFIAFISLIVVGLLSFSYTGSFIKKTTRGYEDRELTEVFISLDGEEYVQNRLMNVKLGKYVYFKVKTGDPFGTNSLVKFLWYPDELSGVNKDEVFKGSIYISGCGKSYCRGGLEREFKYLTLGLEKGLNCVVLEDRGSKEDIPICFNVI
ncbi:MAG: hypothetical protein QGF74_02330 [Candidatus Nanoarchaeia archaeon]|jgi:hypothetical protein|nr:hypothetical protein [Candidatus Nanoarchaeia archaeon]|tara:strand:- start:2361 stop:2831 length:471 start_codon:yes stop_codon:yes gene_type:complete